MATSTVDSRTQEELEGTEDEEEIARVEAARKRRLDRDYPKPDVADVISWASYLEKRFERYRHGSRKKDGHFDDDGGDSLDRIRQMRFGEDTLPSKLAAKRNYADRVRTGLSYNEINRVTALMGRNPIKVEVPATGSTVDATQRSRKQTRFCTNLPKVLDKQSVFPFTQRIDDAMTEAGLVGVEFYLTGEYDDISEDDFPSEDYGMDDSYEARKKKHKAREDYLTAERRKRKMPFGIRYVDPMMLSFELEGDKLGVVVIKEKKRWRHLRRVVNDSLQRSAEELEEERTPDPGDRGSPADEMFGAAGYSDVSDVETIRWYDERWYVYVVGGKLITCEEHGFPGIPVGIGMSRITSASDYSHMFQGVTWGRTSLEQALNDWATMEKDRRDTFGRPKPVATSDYNAAATAFFSEGLNPISVDFSTDDLQLLPPGYHIENAYKDFSAAQNDPMGQLLLSLWERGGMSPIQQGDAPGADPSGYLVNTLANAANAKYEGQLDNKARLYEWIVDFSRLVIRDVIGEPVEISARMSDGKGRTSVQWLSLGPDDIDEVPCEVTIDPMTDTNRMAITGWLMQGMAAGLVPPEIVQTRAYGAEDPEEWNELTLRSSLRNVLRERAVQEALARVDEAAAERERAKLGPNPDGTMPPGPPTNEAPMPPIEGAPPPPRPPTVGGATTGAQRAGSTQANWTAGQRPMQQGVTPREAVSV